MTTITPTAAFGAPARSEHRALRTWIVAAAITVLAGVTFVVGRETAPAAPAPAPAATTHIASSPAGDYPDTCQLTVPPVHC